MSPHESGEGARGGPAARRCGICALIERCRAGAFADFVAELPHSFVILGDAQFYRGYCVVLAKSHVDEIHLMPPAKRARFSTRRWRWAARSRLLHAAQAQLRMSRQSGTARPLARLSALRVGPDAAAPVWMRPESERKVTLEDSDRHGLIQALAAELSRQVSGARVAAGR